MRKKYWFIIVSFMIAYCIFNDFLLKSSIVGTYCNTNFELSPIHPKIPDTLILSDNNEYYSKQIGYGSYKIHHSLSGTLIDFEGNSNNMSRYMSRTWTGIPKIIIFHDTDHFYKKLTSNSVINYEEITKAKRKSKLDKAVMEEEIRKIQEQMYNKPADTTGNN